MNNFKLYIKDNFSFSNSDIEAILACFDLKKIAKKDFFLKEGAYCRQVAFIEKGCFLYYQIIDGEEKVIEFFTENDIFTDYYSYLTGKMAKGYMRATEDSIIISVQKNDFEEILKGNGATGFKTYGKEKLDVYLSEEMRKKGGVVEFNKITFTNA